MAALTPDLWRDWAPIRVYRRDGRWAVDWCFLDGARFTAPFFDETIGSCLQRPFNLVFRRQTPIEALVDTQTAAPGIRPTGFIFHMSRCGSTLVSQMLAALPSNIMISEASVIESVLRAGLWDHSVTDAQRIAWLQGVISALGRPRTAQEQRLFIKFDSWHTVDLGLIRRAYPDVPWIFLYREPAEVLVSHRRQPGAQMVPGIVGPGWMGLDMTATAALSLDEYAVRVLATICQGALAHRDDGGLFVNYRQLPEAVFAEIAGHFGATFDAAELDRMRRAAVYDAKAPSLLFTADTAAKQAAVTPAMRGLAEQQLGPLYAELEAVRLGRAGEPLAFHRRLPEDREVDDRVRTVEQG